MIIFAKFLFVMRRFLLLFSLFVSLAAPGQNKKDSFWRDLNDFLNMREDKSYAKLDSNYIGRYPYHWDARLFYNSTSLRIRVDGLNDVDLATGMNHRAGIGLSYRGLGLSYSRAIGKKLNFNFSLDSYGKHFGFEYALRFTTALKGTVKTPSSESPMENLVLGESRLNLFYSFNSRFSYAAAMKQSKIQRRSAGSFIASASWSVWDVVSLDGFGTVTDPEEMESVFDLLQSNLLYNRVSIGAGYGYNWVLGNRHWLIHGSLVPMWTVYEATTDWEKGKRSHHPYPYGWVTFCATGRAAVSYQWGERWSLGLNGVINQMVSRNTKKGNDFHRFGAQDWQIRLSLSFRFGSR